MIASAPSPLEGFLGKADYDGVVEEMRLANGLPWALPVYARGRRGRRRRRPRRARRRGRHAPRRARGRRRSRVDKKHEAEQCYRTTEDAHPGVARLSASTTSTSAARSRSSSGPKPRSSPSSRSTRRRPRPTFAERGWQRVVGFQTRNPIHRAHEYLPKRALEIVDGLLLHPLVGDTKGDDIPADVRMECYEVLLENYYPKDRVLLACSRPRCATPGPREAIFHAIVRKNYGCTHFIVGRDHAGVGNYYGTYDAQHIFDELRPGELGIQPLFFEHAFYCKACGQMALDQDLPARARSRAWSLRGTKVREMLARASSRRPSSRAPRSRPSSSRPTPTA